MRRTVSNVGFTRWLLSLGFLLFVQIGLAKAYDCYFDGAGKYVFTAEQDVSFDVEGKDEVGAMRVVNYDGKTVQSIPVTVRGKRQPVTLGRLAPGIYWITEVDGRVLYSFAVIPPAGRMVKSEDSPFGVYYAYVNGEVDRAQPRLDILKKAGIVWLRCSTYVTPKKENPDSFDWSARDEFVKMVNDRDLNMLSFFETINFPSEAFPPREKGETAFWKDPRTLRAIGDYVSHNLGKLKYFEVWNEPVNPDEWIAFSKAFYQTVKKANPDAVVVQSGLAACGYPGQWGCKFMAQDMQKKAFSLGLEKFTDVFNFHFYPYQWKTEDIISQFMAVYAQHKQTKPVWVTENGMAAAPKDMYQQKQQAEYLVRSMATCFHLGIDKYFWFLAWDHPEFPYGLLDDGLQPKASYPAYAVLTKMLDGVELGSSTKLNQKNITGFVFKTPKGQTAVLWTDQGSMVVDPRALIPNQPRVAVYDIMGRAMSVNDQGKVTLDPQAPVYVVAENKGAH